MTVKIRPKMSLSRSAAECGGFQYSKSTSKVPIAVFLNLREKGKIYKNFP